MKVNSLEKKMLSSKKNRDYLYIKIKIKTIKEIKIWNYGSNKDEKLIRNISQKKFYPNPQEIAKIYPCMINLFAQFVRRGNFILSYSDIKKNDILKRYLQESFLIFNVEEYNQNYYAREYEVQVGGDIDIKENKEITEQIDQEIISKPNEIVLEFSEECKLTEEQTVFISNEIIKFKNYEDDIVKYKNTIGVHINNLTSSLRNNSIHLCKTSKSGLDRHIYIEKGIIKINRNEKDFIRSITEGVIDIKDNKGLQDYNIGDEKHRVAALEIMKGIGGYNNVKYYDIKIKQEYLNLLIQLYMLIKKNN